MTTIPSLINARHRINLTPDRHEFHAKRPRWEIERVDSCEELMKPGMCVYDLGAECGDFTALYGMWVGESGTVVPVEPSPPVWPQLRAHWEANDLPPLKGYFPGFASFADSLEPELKDDTYASTFPGEDGWPKCSIGPILPDFGFRHLAQQLHHTPALSLDTMAKSLNLVPDAIVMDIEGAELMALMGAHRLLLEVKPIMWVSVHPPTMAEWYNHTVDDLLRYMDSVGYGGLKLGEGSEEYWIFQARP
jgi:FkbM family methyltransferase